KLGIDDDKIVIGSVGRLNHIKNYTLLINAVALLSAKERVAVLLVGDGPERERLHASAKDYGIADNLIITGARTDIPDMLSVMDFFVLPSLLEGMSNSILEAMCAGLPVVASNVGGNPELVRHGQTGLIFESGSAEALKEKIETLIFDSPRRISMGRNAREAAKKHYSLQAMAGKYETLYRHIQEKRVVRVDA